MEIACICQKRQESASKSGSIQPTAHRMSASMSIATARDVALTVAKPETLSLFRQEPRPVARALDDAFFKTASAAFNSAFAPVVIGSETATATQGRKLAPGL